MFIVNEGLIKLGNRVYSAVSSSYLPVAFNNCLMNLFFFPVSITFFNTFILSGQEWIHIFLSDNIK